MREAVGPAGYPFLAAPGNAERLADQIVELAMNQALRIQVGMDNRQRSQTEFSMSRMCKQTLDVIARGCKRPGD